MSLSIYYTNVMHDFIAIGDTTIDAFIRIKDAAVHCNVKTDTCEICMGFATKVPYESVNEIPAVGNSANAAVAAARLGLAAGFVANIGDDENGKKCLASLQKDNVTTDFIKINQNMRTNYHYVLWYEDDRTILIKHENYPYALPEIGAPKWVYLSSMSENSLEYHKEIVKYLNAYPDIKLAYQPGTFQIKMSDQLSELYKRTGVFVCNVTEAEKILNTENTEPKNLLKKISELGPKIVLITDGKNGAYCYDSQNNKTWQMPIYPDPKPPLDRTGAGDAYAATFVCALALGKSIEEALTWAPINSMSVVQYVGAQEGLLTREKLEQFLKSAPENYKPIQI